MGSLQPTDEFSNRLGESWVSGHVRRTIKFHEKTRIVWCDLDMIDETLNSFRTLS